MLWLDDIRNPSKFTRYDGEIVWVESYDEFVEWITKNGLPDIISFDHDLAQEHYAPVDIWDDPVKCQEWMDTQEFEGTGYDAAKWLVKYCEENGRKLPDYLVHSANPVGAENILKYLENAKKYLDI